MLTPTPTEPSAPTGLTATAGDGSIDLEWDDPGDTSINGYDYCTTTTSGADCTSWHPISGATATTTMHTISGLMNGTTYYVQIRARNSEGASGASNKASATPRATTVPPPTSTPTTPTTYALAATAGAGGSVSCATASGPASCSGTFEVGTGVTVTAEAGDDYDFSHWTGDCADQGASCALTMSGPRSTQAHFAAEPPEPDTAPMFDRESVPYWTTVGRSVRQTLPGASGGNGALTYSLSGNLPPGHEFEEPRTVRGAATAVGRYESILTVDDSDDNHAASDQDTLTVIITVWPRAEWTLTVTESGCCGTVSQSPSGPYYQDANPPVTVTLTATPNDGYQVDSWSGDCSGTGLTCQLTMDADKTASVTFEAVPTYTVSASLEEQDECGGWDCGGSVSVSPSGPYTPNTEITVTASLDDLTFLDEWEMTVGSVTTTHNGETLTFDITGNTTVTGYIRSVCEVMIEVCPLSREEDDGGGEQPPPPP